MHPLPAPRTWRNEILTAGFGRHYRPPGVPWTDLDLPLIVVAAWALGITDRVGGLIPSGQHRAPAEIEAGS